MKKTYYIVDSENDVIKEFEMTEIALERVIEKIDDIESYLEEDVENEENTESEDYRRLMKGKG